MLVFVYMCVCVSLRVSAFVCEGEKTYGRWLRRLRVTPVDLGPYVNQGPTKAARRCALPKCLEAKGSRGGGMEWAVSRKVQRDKEGPSQSVEAIEDTAGGKWEVSWLAVSC